MKSSDAIKAMLAKRNTSQAKLAHDMGVTASAVNGYINGQQVKGVYKPVSITMDTAVEIAAALGYRVAFVPTDKVPASAFVVDERTAPPRQRGLRE
ncbi:helix-turn-helix transcriptional regulator [Candidatus Saccharibacteria bacterium]|nr:helix-turn-helix transcriptional regulator [Candidatus Saccharibacteria bacterium]